MMRRFLSYVKGWRGLTLAAYMWLILMAWVVVYVDVFSAEMKKRFYVVSVAETLLLLLLYVCPKILRRAESLSVKPDEGVLTRGEKVKFFLKCWLGAFAALFVMYLIFYPGGFDIDALSQYSQSIGRQQYGDWHPVMNTLFAFKLPLFLSGYWKGSPALFQVIVSSLSLAYMSCTLLEYANRKYARLFLIYILLNPATLNLFLLQPKDNSFSMAMLLLMVFAVRVYFTNGKWLQSFVHSVIFVVVLTAGSLFRHNAVLFTLPLFFAVSLYIKKGRAVAIFMCTIVLVYLIRYPLYDSLGVIRPGKRQIETLGVPVTIIGNAVKESPEKLDKDILEFAYSLAPEDVWREKYNIIQGFTTVKTAMGFRARNEEERQRLYKVINVDTIEATDWRKILDMSARCFRQAPVSSLRGFLGVTSLVYSIAGPPLGRIVPTVWPEAKELGLVHVHSLDLSFVYDMLKKFLSLSGAYDYQSESGGGAFRFTGFHDESNTFTLQSLVILCNYAVMVLFRHVFWCIGLLNLVVIIFVLAKLDFSTLSGWKRMCFALPMLVHNFGTMLLLSGNDFRYFYCSYLVLPLILLVLLRDSSKEALS